MSGWERDNHESDRESPGFKRIYGTAAANFVNDALCSGQRQHVDSSTGEKAKQLQALYGSQGGTSIGSNTQMKMTEPSYSKFRASPETREYFAGVVTVNYLPSRAI